MGEVDKSVQEFLLPEEKQKRTEWVYEKLKGGILGGSIPAGFVFPNENEMCASLSVGRGTLRDAYSTLAANGLITRNRSGTQVNNLLQIVKNAPVQLVAEIARFQDVLELRLLIECENARLAAERATEAELKRLAGIMDESERSLGDHANLQRLDLEFHSTLSDCSHNILLMNVFCDVWSIFGGYVISNYNRLSSISPDVLDEAAAHHRAVYEAVAGRDGKLASAKMREHIQRVYEGY